jgi:hypothetical protein
MRLGVLRAAGCLCVSIALLTGCAGSEKSAPRLRGPVCDEAVGRAAAAGTADARAFAQGSLTYQIQDLRGFLAEEGLRNIAVQSQRVECQPYVVGFISTGLKLCVATARVCGH